MRKNILLVMVLSVLLTALGAMPAVASSSSTSSGTTSISAKALTDHECDSSEWHIVITQVRSEEDAPSSVFVTYNSGATEVVPFQKYTGKTAHYQTTNHLDDVIKSITAEIYSEWSGQFNLSHGPCSSDEPEPEVEYVWYCGPDNSAVKVEDGKQPDDVDVFDTKQEAQADCKEVEEPEFFYYCDSSSNVVVGPVEEDAVPDDVIARDTKQEAQADCAVVEDFFNKADISIELPECVVYDANGGSWIAYGRIGNNPASTIDLIIDGVFYAPGDIFDFIVEGSGNTPVDWAFDVSWDTTDGGPAVDASGKVNPPEVGCLAVPPVEPPVVTPPVDTPPVTPPITIPPAVIPPADGDRATSSALIAFGLIASTIFAGLAWRTKKGELIL